MECIILDSIGGQRVAKIRFNKDEEEEVIKKLKSVGFLPDVRSAGRCL